MYKCHGGDHSKWSNFTTVELLPNIVFYIKASNDNIVTIPWDYYPCYYLFTLPDHHEELARRQQDAGAVEFWDLTRLENWSFKGLEDHPKSWK